MIYSCISSYKLKTILSTSIGQVVMLIFLHLEKADKVFGSLKLYSNVKATEDIPNLLLSQCLEYQLTGTQSKIFALMRRSTSVKLKRLKEITQRYAFVTKFFRNVRKVTL